MISPVISQAFRALEFEHVSPLHKNNLAQELAEHVAISSKIQAVTAKIKLGQSQNFFKDPDQLKMVIAEDHVKNATIILLTDLASTDELNILDLDDNVLFEYYGDHNFKAHPRINELAKTFIHHPCNRYVYSKVLEIAKILKKTEDYDIHSLALTLSESALLRSESIISFFTSLLEEEQASYQKAQEILKSRKPQDFVFGDFSFIACHDLQKFLQSAYDFFLKKEAFDRAEFTDQDWDEFDAQQGGLSEKTIQLCQAHFSLIKVKGWQGYVRDIMQRQSR